ncbi:Ig-like domain-containing protein [Rhodococcus sp. NPDC004095]
MRLTLPRRLATPMIAATAAAGLVLGVTGGVAAADPPQSSNSITSAQLVLSKEVVGSNVVHPGDTVSYKITVAHTGSGIELSIPEVKDIPPAGFTLVPGSAKATYLGSTTRASISTNSDGGASAKCTSGCTFLVGGFVVKSGQNVTLEASYTVPANQPFGVYDSGVIVKPNTWQTDQGSRTFGVNVEVADPAVNTTTSLQAPASAKTGEAVTLTANVGPANAVGTVQFKDGGNNIGGPIAVSGGNAVLSHTFDTVGAHSVTAEFTAGAGFHNSVSTASTVDVTADTTTTLTVPATAVVGDDVTLSATVSPATATGRVQFKDGATDVGAPVDVVNGAASITRKFAEAGTHNFTANFVGTGGYSDSASAASPLTVTDADFGTTTTVLEPVTAVVGTPVNLSATVFPIPSGGDVTFKVDGTPVGTAPVGTGDGVAVLPHTFTAAGSANVVAEFTGTAGFTPSTSAGFTVTVSNPDTRAATSTALAVSGNAAVGQTVTLTATVDPANADGTVQFKAGTTEIGAPVAVVNGVATLTHTFDAEGTYAVTANFVGGSGFKDSVSGPTVLTVSAAGTPGGGGTGSADFGSLTDLFSS